MIKAALIRVGYMPLLGVPTKSLIRLHPLLRPASFMLQMTVASMIEYWEGVVMILSNLNPARESRASYSEGVRSCPPVTASMMTSSTLLKSGPGASETIASIISSRACEGAA